MVAGSDSLLFNGAIFLSSLLILERGGDLFVDHSALLALRLRVPQSLVALLTAGAEWEEFFVVVFALVNGWEALAIGNVLGSCISNILGAFSLGLMVGSAEDAQFDSGARIYASVLAVLTFVVSLMHAAPLSKKGVRAAGMVLVAGFVVYVVSVLYMISRGAVAAPEDSDSDSNADSDAEDPYEPNERTPLNPDARAHASPPTRHPRGAAYHLIRLLWGFALVMLSSYLLTIASSNLAKKFGMPDLVFGVVVLSIATTLPEKYIAILAGKRGHFGILAATTVGSNIFLLTLCLGTTWIVGQRRYTDGVERPVELSVLLAATAAMAMTVTVGSGRLLKVVGAVMLLAYVAFIVAEVVYSN